MWRAFFKALFAALGDYFRQRRIDQDYQEALVENAMHDAAASAEESDRKARERMADAQAASVGEPASRIRERLRKRPADTR